MMIELAGRLDAQNLRFGIVLARFNSRVTERLLAGALDALSRHGASEDAITVARVPGAFELAQALRALAAGKTPPDALLGLAALVRGETPHFDHLAAVVTRALDRVAADTRIAVANGVLTCESTEQALDRSGGKGGNKGFEAAMSAIEMAQLLRQLPGR
ncbi:MAG: 6,7-dimethyl-8-ribityllumazine synthase [Acidobacteriota bacterium]|nr:MAG: 6,7-dimethyl-8-ribityllumazine synthase [Acidobacteriota bacterium]